jgi:hypothetical protein
MSCHEVTYAAELGNLTLATAGQKKASVTNTKGETTLEKIRGRTKRLENS